MTSPTETVTDFLVMLEKPGGFADAIRAYFTPTTRYLNVGMSDTTGIDDTLAFVDGFMASTRTSWMRAEMLALAAEGNKVLTERIDHLYDADDKLVMSLAVMGIFEVADGKVTGWRDYFDTAGIAGGAGT
ncbi:MAG: limonene-1,2-epoxide hydrolase family protein [Novosphingobium sp.]